ncbi:MAG: hypothetical protein GF375_02585 [Candidatus Omnitrophica bacterium]|nr:hypothetical protein [Candidatus Omnitrophota bacterium]
MKFLSLLFRFLLFYFIFYVIYRFILSFFRRKPGSFHTKEKRRGKQERGDDKKKENIVDAEFEDIE